MPHTATIAVESSKSSLVKPMPAKVASNTSRVSPWLTSLLYPLGHYVVLPFHFGKIEITGQEHLPKDGPVILAPTHRSRWDALMMPYSTGQKVTGRDLRFMVTADEVKGLQGWFIRNLGGFPVDLKHPAIGTLRYGVELLLDREMLVIFPEGGIFQDGEVHPIKPGLARLAMQAELSKPGLGVKIVPMSIRYRPRIPQWGCQVKIAIGSPISVADYANGGGGKKEARLLSAQLEMDLKKLDES
ncbi:1-acyl-sn-glycerol-3-phosphate acyltransferase [Microcoleus vaginatus PCC 9802]|uniref:lysophospholipid acyltransferase family protein n=1 Tax=Microcoleus vaginatus TaxID=119532 RepID=UPI00020D155D|nr:phospholipid/glycerol acyltransferase [Microcoleus vaginatus FGP-2]UNU18233.1 1-acyl-sn-glycerol-3-phosphate acyltransferase [Microcoleus vaginatus PCC 9802]